MKRDFYELYLKKIRQYGGLKDYARYKAKGPVGMMVKRISCKFPSGSKILEIGTGTGVLAALLAERSFDVTAIDNDERMTALAQKCSTDLRVSVSVQKMDMFGIASSFGRGNFGCVVSHGVMEHYDDDSIIYAFNQQLTVGGMSVFCIPGIAMSQEYKARGDGSERYLTSQEWLEIITRGNFQCKAVFGAGFGKYCKYPFLPHWFSRSDTIGSMLAGSAAFMEFWIHKH